jgi:hypothetical protein
MKKTLIFIITIILVISCAAVGVCAEESETVEATETIEQTVELATDVAESASDTITETVETITETSEETAEGSTDASTEAETEDIAAIIGGADNKLEAIVGLAGAMGITLEEAEAILDKMVALGDEHLGETDIWMEIKASILNNPETWTIVVLVALMLVALAVFLIRGQIKNTSAQAATKANIIDIKKNEAEMRTAMSAATTKLSAIGREHETIKLQMDEIYQMAEDMLKNVEESMATAEKICEMATLMLSAVDLLKANSETSLNVNREQALQTVQLLNIAMGRQMPRVSDTTRKVWYEDAVAKIKETSTVSDEVKAEAAAADKQ